VVGNSRKPEIPIELKGVNEFKRRVRVGSIGTTGNAMCKEAFELYKDNAISAIDGRIMSLGGEHLKDASASARRFLLPAPFTVVTDPASDLCRITQRYMKSSDEFVEDDDQLLGFMMAQHAAYRVVRMLRPFFQVRTTTLYTNTHTLWADAPLRKLGGVLRKMAVAQPKTLPFTVISGGKKHKLTVGNSIKIAHLSSLLKAQDVDHDTDRLMHHFAMPAGARSTKYMHCDRCGARIIGCSVSARGNSATIGTLIDTVRSDTSLGNKPFRDWLATPCPGRVGGAADDGSGAHDWKLAKNVTDVGWMLADSDTPVAYPSL